MLGVCSLIVRGACTCSMIMSDVPSAIARSSVINSRPCEALGASNGEQVMQCFSSKQREGKPKGMHEQKETKRNEGMKEGKRGDAKECMIK